MQRLPRTRGVGGPCAIERGCTQSTSVKFPPWPSSRLALPNPSLGAQEARAASSEPKVSPTRPTHLVHCPRCPQYRRPFAAARVSPALEAPHYLHALTTRPCCTACDSSRRIDLRRLCRALFQDDDDDDDENDAEKNADDNADDGARRHLILLLGCRAVVPHG